MNANRIRRQIDELIGRLLSTSLAARTFTPSVKSIRGGGTEIGSNRLAGISLKDIAYQDIYHELNINNAYHVKLIDGGLLLFQYAFAGNGLLSRHRLAYFPNPTLPSIDETPELYEQDSLYADILAKNIVRFPIRFDYAPNVHINIFHPASHLTLGQYENCRIPVFGPMSPISFGMFVVRNFYFGSYKRYKNTFDRRAPAVGRLTSITESEKRLTHIIHGM